jgi:CARDB/Zinc carboxypeptidase
VRFKTRLLAVALACVMSLGVSASSQPAMALPNPVAMSDAEYLAYGRVFSDPHGCLAHDTDGDGTNDVVPPGVSPWAKGNMCMAQYLSYEEAVEGMRFLARKFPRFLSVIRLDQAYDDGNLMSAGIPRAFVIDDGKVKPIDRDRRPLYLLKVTDSQSPVPEPMRLHFVYAGAIHGIERAGAEGGLRAMEDLVTWAATSPAKRIVEAPTDKPVPTAKDSLERSVIYFILPNPDGWARGQVHPAELEDGSPNLNYTPGVFYQRYNGNGMDLNRDWPGVGYTYRPYSPGSEPETRAYMHALRSVRATISPNNPVGQRFAGGIDLHGQLTASAFSYTLLGAGQRDFRKNFSTVDQGLRTWEDQTTRLAWSPYIGTPVAPVADQWGTVIDTLGYQVSGALGDWIENEEIGLGAVGIDNEMSISHLAPNNIFEPTIEQMHIDGNKGLIYSQLASMLTEEQFRYRPAGKLGYVLNPLRITNDGTSRIPNPGLPAQNDIDVILPCQSAGGPNIEAALPCEEGTFSLDGAAYNLEFEVRGPIEGIWNGGITVTMTNANATGISTGSLSRLSLQKWDDDVETWENIATAFVQGGSPDAYLQSGQIVTANDPMEGLWRVRVTNGSGTGLVRVKIDFNPVTAEESPGQAAFSSSSMDFFTDLNRYIPDPADHAEALAVEAIVANPSMLDRFDSLVVVNTIGQRSFLVERLGLSGEQADAFFAALHAYAQRGGNLVLTDGALSSLAEMGVLPANQIRDGLASTTTRGQAASYSFNVAGRGNTCNNDPLTRDVCLPGTAGGTSRVAVEPTPLGYPPDGTLDNEAAARLRQWWVQRTAWEDGCGKDNPAACTAALMLGGQAGIGERHLGDGVIRIVGAMFPDPSFLPDETRDMRFGLQSYALSFSAWQIFLNLVDYERPVTASNQADLVVADVATASKVGEGDNALIRATVVNHGGGDAAASLTGFVLDGETVLGSVDTPLIPAGDSAEVSLNWPTGGIKGEHTISVTADATGVLDEVDEANNLGVLTANVKGNKVTNGSFEQANSAGNGPEGWEGDSTGAGTSSWSDGGSDGERSVSISGTGRSAVLHGAPSWTSAPISVNAGELLSLSVDVRSQGLSSAPSVGLAYLGPAGALLDTVSVLSVPLATDGFTHLARELTVPSGVSAVRVVLYAFAPTDLCTSGTVTFDNVVLAEH